MANRTLKIAAIGSVSALALAGMTSTATADSLEMYGWIHGAVTYQADDEGQANLNFDGGTDNNAPSRFGIRGGTELAPGIDGFAHVEFGIIDDDGMNEDRPLRTRLSNAGLAFDDVGRVTVGTQWSQQYLWVTSQTDVFMGAHHSLTNATNTVYRRDNALSFISDDFNGFQFAVIAEADRGQAEDEIDVVHGAVRYGTGPVEVAASVFDEQFDGGRTIASLAGTYDFDVAALSATVQNTDPDEGDDMTNFDVAVTVPVDNWTFAAKVALFDSMDDGDDVIGFGGEAVYTFADGAADTYFGLSDNDADGDNMIAATGVRVHF